MAKEKNRQRENPWWGSNRDQGRRVLQPRQLGLSAKCYIEGDCHLSLAARRLLVVFRWQPNRVVKVEVIVSGINKWVDDKWVGTTILWRTLMMGWIAIGWYLSGGPRRWFQNGRDLNLLYVKEEEIEKDNWGGKWHREWLLEQGLEEVLCCGSQGTHQRRLLARKGTILP